MYRGAEETLLSMSPHRTRSSTARNIHSVTANNASVTASSNGESNDAAAQVIERDKGINY